MFDIQGNKIKLSTEDLAIPPFKDYYNNAEDKTHALKVIEYVIWNKKWNSPYNAYPEKDRASKIAYDVFGDANYIPDDTVKDLMQRFTEFQETPGTRLLTASRSAAEGLIEALSSYSEDGMDIDTAIKVARILKDVGNIVKSLDIAEKQTKAEQQETGRIKGGGTLSAFEIA